MKKLLIADISAKTAKCADTQCAAISSQIISVTTVPKNKKLFLLYQVVSFWNQRGLNSGSDSWAVLRAQTPSTKQQTHSYEERADRKLPPETIFGNSFLLNRHNTEVTHCCGSFHDDCYCSEERKRKRSRYFPFRHPRMPNFPLKPKSFRYFLGCFSLESAKAGKAGTALACSLELPVQLSRLSSPSLSPTSSRHSPTLQRLLDSQTRSAILEQRRGTYRESWLGGGAVWAVASLPLRQWKVSQLREGLRANVFLLSTNSLLPHSPPSRTLSPPLLPPPSVSIHSSARARCLFAQIQLTKTRKFTMTESSERRRGKAADLCENLVNRCGPIVTSSWRAWNKTFKKKTGYRFPKNTLLLEAKVI